MARVERGRRYFSWTFMVILTVLIIILFFGAMLWVNADIEKLQAQDENLRLSNQKKNIEYEDLVLQLDRMGSDGYVENEAREKYDFIREGEIIFAFENPEALKGYTQEEYQIILDEMRD